MEEADVTNRLAQFAADLRFESLPSDVVEFAKLCIIDQFGIQLFLSTLPVSRIAFDYATSVGTGPCSILGSAKKALPEFAAFANGVAGHAFELDDMHLPSLNHPGPIVVSSAFAVGEQARANGKKFIEAVIAGYEVMGRIGRGMGRDYVYGRGYHPVGVLGPIGSAIAAAKVWGLSKEQMFHSLGLATSHGAGTIEYNQTWGETTRLHAGLAAMGGIRSASLARAGLRGPGSPVAGKYGFARVHSDQCDFEMMVSELGKTYLLLFNAFKLRPYHGVLHAVIDKTLELLTGSGHKPTEDPSDKIKHVKIGLNSAAMRGLVEGEDESQDRTESSTHLQFSLRAPLANAIVYGGTIDSILSFKPDDPKIRRTVEKISAAFDQECEAEWYKDKGHRGSKIFVRVAIEFYDGRTINGFGNPFEKPRTPEQLFAKFHDLAGRVLPKPNVSELLGRLQRLETIRDVNDLGALIAPKR